MLATKDCNTVLCDELCDELLTCIKTERMLDYT